MRDIVQRIYRRILHQYSRFFINGQNIYEFDWDLLIILDGCRIDLLENVASEYEFITEVNSITSVDTRTLQWMEKTFTTDYRNEMANTHYICGNPFSDEVLNAGEFECIDEVWRSHWDYELGALSPRPITDRAISIGRNTEFDRLILHYMQPHWPFIPSKDLSDKAGINLMQPLETRVSNDSAIDHDIWVQLQKGEVSKEEVWEGYVDNLRFVLDDVGLLLTNIDAERVVITSDHGNAMGEWGIYGHPMHMPFDCLRRVPWVETEAKDKSTHTPDPESLIDEEVATDVKSRLKDLGYR